MKESGSMGPFRLSGLKSTVVPRRCSSIFVIAGASLKPVTVLLLQRDPEEPTD